MGIGLIDSVLVHPREVFRAAIVAASHAIVVVHNHPSGEPTPSEADIRITKELVRAGQLLRIEVLDRVIMGGNRHDSPQGIGAVVHMNPLPQPETVGHFGSSLFPVAEGVVGIWDL